jgi:two-component system, sensor histidine kinase and response regulator
MMSPVHEGPTGIEILLVEDSPTQAARLRYLMESRGFSTRVAGNGRQALAALRERRASLVLSDVVMPEMDG